MVLITFCTQTWKRD